MQATVLVVDGIVTNRIMLKVQLSAAYYHVVQADRMENIVTLVRRTQPDLILTAMSLPDGNAVALREMLAGDPQLAAIPVIAIAMQNDRNAQMRALAAGIDEVLVQPVDDRMLQARIRSLLRMRSSVEMFRNTTQGPDPTSLGFGEAAAPFSQPARIALIAGTAVLGRQWKAALQARGGLRYALEGNADIATLMTAPLADAFVIRIGPDSARRGLDLLADLRSRAATCHAVLIAVVDPPDAELAAEALDRGASDVLQRGFCAEELLLRLAVQLPRKALADRLRDTVRDNLRDVVRDPLTGLFNRRHAMPRLAATVRAAAASGEPFAVMLADLDHFKQINDSHGHPAGDAVLVETARRMSAILRPQDMLARIGGEEFMAVLPAADLAEATAIAGRLCREINSRTFTLAGETGIAVTISIGLVMGQPGQAEDPETTAERLVSQADQALYAAKGAGRNKISLIRPAA